MAYFWTPNFRWQNFLVLLELWTFNVVFVIGIWTYAIWFVLTVPVAVWNYMGLTYTWDNVLLS